MLHSIAGRWRIEPNPRSTVSPQMSGRPSARALKPRAAEPRERWSGGIGSARALDGPPDEREAERESAHAGRRGLGASEARSARSARALDGPPDASDEQRRHHERDRAQQLDQHVQARAGGAL